MTETILANAQLVLADEVLRGSLRMVDGQITAIETGVRVPAGAVDCDGDLVMPGMIELGEEVFHMPVRLGIPKYNGALADVVQNPRFSTACGLLMEAQTQRKRGLKVRETNDVKQVFSRMKAWFEKNF